MSSPKSYITGHKRIRVPSWDSALRDLYVKSPQSRTRPARVLTLLRAFKAPHHEPCPKALPRPDLSLEFLAYSHTQTFASRMASPSTLFSDKVSAPVGPFQNTQEGGLPPTLELR